MSVSSSVEVTVSWWVALRAGLLPWRCASVLLVLLLCAFGASTAEGATCFVDDATGNDMNMCCTPMGGACKTIQAAVNQATSGDTINVAAGTYPESALDAFLEIDKTLTVLGAQAGVDARGPRGPESIITDYRGTGVKADNVVIDGFTIQDSVQVNLTGYGIWLEPGTSGTTIVNNIFQNNIIGLGITNTGPEQLLIRHNLFQNNNQGFPMSPASGTGIYTDQFISQGAVTNVLIEENDFKGNNNSGIDLSNTDAMQGVSNIEIRNNSFDMNGRAFDIFNTHMLSFHDNSVTNCTLAGSAALRIFDFNTDLTIMNNELDTGVGYGIRLSDLADPSCCPLGPSQRVEIHWNNIFPFMLGGLLVDPMSHVNSVNATCNWWGSATGPTNPANPGGTGLTVQGDAIFDCWLIAPAPEGPCCLPTPTPTSTPTSTPTATPTVTPTATPTGPGIPGDLCTDPSQCNGNLFCADGVCCDMPCDGPSESCVVPGHVGFCSRPQLVPATSGLTQAAIVGLLLVMGWFGLRAMRRGGED